MSNRLKRFAIVSLVGVVLAAAVLVLFYRHLAIGTLRKNYDAYNSALAQMLLNTLRPYHISELLAFYGDSAALDSQLPQEVQNFERQVTDSTESLPILSVTFYDEDGIVVYSTIGGGVGRPPTPNKGVVSALDGKVAGDLILRDFLDGVGTHKIDKGLGYYASYIPIRESPNGAVIGVLEARSDVTPLIIKMRNVGNLIILGVVVVLGGFYLVLFLFYYRLDQALQIEEMEREGYLVQVEQTNELLEERVAERTAALEASREFLQSVMNQVVDGILTVDRQWMIETVNRATEKLFGFDASALGGKALADLMPSLATQEGVFSLDDLPSSREFSLGGAQDVTGVRRDGTTFPVDLWVGKLVLEEGEKFIIVVRDVSERMAAEKEIAQTRRQYFHQEKMAAIGQLAAGILHEVGNPIAAISGSIQMLRARFSSVESSDGCVVLDEEFLASLQMVEEQTERLARITREIAEFASPRPMERELLDLNDLIESTTNLLRYDRRWKRVALRLKLDRSLPAIFAVADQLTQIFMNLLINAADAGGTRAIDDPEIEIITSLEDGRMQVAVRDNCGGMDERTLRHACDAFFTTKPAGSGTGLGLSLCDSLITAHQGEMRIESVLDVGTTVYVYLPIEEE